MKKNIYILLIILISSFTANAQTLDRSIRPSAAPAKEVNIKDAQIFTLKNGLKVFLVEDKSTPLTYYSLQLDVKPSLEGDKVGRNALFNEVFGAMTKNRTKEQLNKDIDLIGMRGGVSRYGGYAYYLNKYHDKALELLTDMLFNPVFSQEEFDLALNKYKTDLSAVGDDPGGITNRLATALIYGKGYPAGEVMTVESLDKVTLSDLEDYYNTYFAPNVSRLVIVGNISKKEAQKQAEKYFGKWAKKDVPVTQYNIPVAPAQRKVAFANKPDAVQSAIDVAYPLQFNPKEPDYDAAAIMNQILGGGTGHLFMNLREDKSWTYGIYTSLLPDEQVGSMSLTSGRGAASVKAMATDSAVYEILKEFDRIIAEPVTEQELKDAVTDRAGRFSRSLAESGTIAQFAVNIDKYNLPKDYYRNYLKRMEALTVADIQAAAKKYIKPENAWIIVTGDKQYADKLAQFAGDGKVQWYDYDANPIETPKAQVITIAPETVINNYIKAIGGKEAIDKINDYKITGEMLVSGQSAAIEQYFKKPNLSTAIISMQGTMLQKMAFDGKVLRVSGMQQGPQEITEGDEYEEMKNNASLDAELSYLSNGSQLTIEGVEPVNNEDAYVLKIVLNGKTKTEYYSVNSGLKLRYTQTNTTPGGDIQVINNLSDYREVGGVKIPYKVEQSAMGQVVTTIIKDVEVNTGLKDSVFN
jgi:Predicted Zn-dependent peptidases